MFPVLKDDYRNLHLPFRSDNMMDHISHVEESTIVFTNDRFHREKQQICEGHEETETKPIEDRDRLSSVGMANHTVKGIGDTHDCCE
jgi:hypothetical protein